VNTAQRLVLYCLAHAGGDARMFTPWDVRLPDCIHVQPVQLPGRGQRAQENPVTTVDAAVEQVLTVIDPDRPYALFGHSLGAVLAFEAAACLYAMGAPPAKALIVSAHRAPHLPLREAIIRNLPDTEFITRLRELNGTPNIVLDSPGFLRMLLPALRADFTIAETYRYRKRAPLPGPIVALGGTDDPDVTADELDQWKRHTTAEFRRVLFPGGHFYLGDQRDAVLVELTEQLSS
jgi:medium-chain acyl-[acyl-carrier-protein] hydrolase